MPSWLDLKQVLTVRRRMRELWACHRVLYSFSDRETAGWTVYELDGVPIPRTGCIVNYGSEHILPRIPGLCSSEARDTGAAELQDRISHLDRLRDGQLKPQLVL